VNINFKTFYLHMKNFRKHFFSGLVYNDIRACRNYRKREDQILAPRKEHRQSSERSPRYRLPSQPGAGEDAAGVVRYRARLNRAPLQTIPVPQRVFIQSFQVVDRRFGMSLGALFYRYDQIIEQFQITPGPKRKQGVLRDKPFGIIRSELLIELRHYLSGHQQVVLPDLLFFLNRAVVFGYNVAVVTFTKIEKIMKLVHEIRDAGVFVFQAEHGFNSKFFPIDLVLQPRGTQRKTQYDGGDELNYADGYACKIRGEVVYHTIIYQFRRRSTNCIIIDSL
jgi:hypothetical protein